MTTTAGATASSGSEQRDLPAGLVGAAIAVCAWSTGTVLAKGIEMGGLAIGTYRFWMFSLALIAWMWARRTPFGWRSFKATMFGGIALGADIALFFSAVKETSIVNATIIGSLQPILVGVIAAKVFGETIRGRDAMWSLLALAGVVVIVTTTTADSTSDIKGDLLAVGAMFAWSGYFIASKRSKGVVTPTEFTAGTALWTALIVTPLGFAFGQDLSLPSAKNWALLVAMAVGSGIIGHVLMNWSLVRIPLWVGSTFTLLIPVFSAIIAWVFLDEAIALRQAVAMAVVIGSLAMIVRSQSVAARAAAAHREVLDPQTSPAHTSLTDTSLTDTSLTDTSPTPPSTSRAASPPATPSPTPTSPTPTSPTPPSPTPPSSATPSSATPSAARGPSAAEGSSATQLGDDAPERRT